MKYVTLLCDGCADVPSEQLGGKTPLQAAYKPFMDALAPLSEVGMTHTVPQGMSPGSDVANLSIVGYDPTACYTGRSPLEAANIGVPMGDDDIAFRCNLVTLSGSEDYDSKTILDYCAGDIRTSDADVLIKAVQEAFGGGEFDFYTGTAYRHCMIWHGGKTALGKITPPHDITGRVITDYLPSHPDAAPLLDMMRKSFALLHEHPLNKARAAAGLPEANSIWLWGQGNRPQLENFEACYGLKGAMISAVDLLKGIGRLAGMQVCDVPGATGYIDTNFEGKCRAAVEALKNGCDFAYIHVEAPDECGHRGEYDNKVKAIEEIDRRILGPLLEELRAMGDFTLLVAPDHPTPLCVRTHTADPIPYLLYRSNRPVQGVACYTEETAASTGITIEPACRLMAHMIND